MGEVVQFVPRKAKPVEAPQDPVEAMRADINMRAAVHYPTVSQESAELFKRLQTGSMTAMALYLEGQGVKIDPVFWIDMQHMIPILNGIIERRIGITSPMTAELEMFAQLKQGTSEEPTEV